MKKFILLFVVSAAFIGNAMAQGFKVESVRMILEDPDQSVAKDLKQCKEDIEAEHIKNAEILKERGEV